MTEGAYDRFSRAVDGPLMLLAVLWLPVLTVPLVVHFVETHLLDLVVIAVPFLRPLRVLRFTRAGAVAGDGLTRAKRILTEHGLHYALLAATVLVFAGAAGELLLEENAPHSNIHTFGEALWWAVVTVTTVGYGDFYPVTGAGRAVAVVLMLVGIGLLGVVTANVAAYFVGQSRSAELTRLDEVSARLERIEALLVAQSDTARPDRAGSV